MVTSSDYTSLILRNFSPYISDIKSWGGEDNDVPEFGAVFVSISFVNGLEQTVIDDVKRQIVDLSDQLSIASFNLRFSDPITTFIETNVVFQFNPTLTTLSLNTIQDEVNTVIEQYFEDNVGQFDQSFRRSNMLTLVDEVSPAVLSSRADIKMQQRLVPQVITQNNDGTQTTTSRLGQPTDYLLRFPVDISSPSSSEFILISDPFVYNNTTCILRNKLSSNVIQLISLGTNRPLIDNVGYFTTSGSVYLTGFAPTSITGNKEYIKVSVVPGNQSAISPVRNNLLSFDSIKSSTRGRIVTST